MRQLYAALSVSLFLLLALCHNAVAQSECILPGTFYFGETIAETFDPVPSVTVTDMVILCRSVRGGSTILARYNCNGSLACEGTKETLFDVSCSDGVLAIDVTENVEFDALSSGASRRLCYDCVSPSSFADAFPSPRPGLQFNDSNHCVGKYTLLVIGCYSLNTPRITPCLELSCALASPKAYYNGAMFCCLWIEKFPKPYPVIYLFCVAITCILALQLMEPCGSFVLELTLNIV